MQYLVDRLDGETGNKGLEEGTEVGMLDRKRVEKAIGRGGVGVEGGKRRVVIVCGPEGCVEFRSRPSPSLLTTSGSCSMVNAVAGPRGRNFSQGSVGGILGELGYTKQEVVKL